MERNHLPVPKWLNSDQLFNRQELESWAKRHWKSGLFLLVALYLCLQKDITIDFMVSSPSYAEPALEEQYPEEYEESATPAMNVSMMGDAPIAEFGNPLEKPASKKKKVLSPAEQAKKDKQLAYVSTYKDVAIKEMEKYGIPASITLAQGILESNMGQSKLATRNNNHFGIKCFSRSCRKGHCSNFTDDSHKDFFRKYSNVWDSYRAHSSLLQGKRYKHLAKLGTSNYRDWAHGLKKAGYATDKRYAEKLIRYIEDLELDQYDS